MKRNHFRTCLVLVAVLALGMLVVPVAEAKPFKAPKPLAGLEAPWLQSIMAWLNGYLGLVSPAEKPRPGKSQAEAAATEAAASESDSTDEEVIDLPGQGESMWSGSCIDPQGRPRPCGS